jgi:hypothetical protein
MLHTHVLNRGGRGVEIPADRLTAGGVGVLARHARRASRRRMGEGSRGTLLTAQDDSAYVSPDLEGAIDRVKSRELWLLLVRINVVRQACRIVALSIMEIEG